MGFLKVTDLEYYWGKRLVLPRISFAVGRGKFGCLLGPSGCGKTTLLRLLAGLQSPHGGSIALDDNCISSPAHTQPPEQRQMGMVFQQPTLFPTKNVADNIGFGLKTGEARSKRIHELLEHIGLSAYATAMPHQLSGGQQHRVALARALAASPKLLLLDEPFAHLDPERRLRLRNETKQLTQREGVTCLMVTHDAAEAMQMGDHVILMDSAGQIRQQGTAHDVYHHPADRYAALALGEMNLLPATSDGKTMQTVLGAFDSRSNESGKVMLAVRPHYVELHAPDQGAQGHVQEVLCTGPEDFLNIQLPDGTMLQARVKHTHHWRKGDKVGIRITPNEYHCFSAD